LKIGQKRPCINGKIR